MRVVYDTCVIIDALQDREPFYPVALKLILAAVGEQIIGLLTAKTLMDIHYLRKR